MPMKNFIFALLLIPFGLTAQIGAKVQKQDKIFGVWQNNQFGYQMTLMLDAKGTGEFDGDPVTFTTQANNLVITQNGTTTDYIYELKNGSLTLSGGDLDEPVIFSRYVNPNAKTNTPNTLKKSDTPTTPETDSNLIGVWSGSGESIEFKTDGNCIYLGNTFPYEISQGHVVLTTSQGKIMFAYSIQGDELVISANGKQVLYNRGNGNAGNNSVANNNAGGVAMELVGKWCYVNVTSTYSGGSSADECIVLNADGTYIYSSERSMSVNTDAYAGGTNSQSGDRGTWYVQGDRIYYNSQSQGQGSYRLEKRNHPKNVNDPMIVLDGKAFVTQTSRQPWR